MPMVDGLSERLQENVECSTHVDIAVAWATKTSALGQLVNAVEENGVSLRIIVGTHGNATDPDALDKLNDIGKLRLVPHEGPLFHPKVYIFRGKENSTAWIGSANFTNGGFGGNVEAVFETKKWKSALRWFEKQWKECGELPANAIARYRRRRRLNPPSRVLRNMMGTPEREPEDRIEYLDRAQNWRGYIHALTQCQEWWEGHPGGWTVYGATRSWTHTIEKVKPIAVVDNWDALNENEIKQLLGRYSDADFPDSGLLGTMRPKAVNRFEDKELRRRLNAAVNPVVNAPSNRFPDVAVTAVDNITGEQDIGIGIATRILALARPDRLVSLNGASKEGLAQIFPGIDRLSNSGDYGKFLGRLYEEPWFDSKEPSDAFGRRLWSMRAALLDCFVYLPVRVVTQQFTRISS